MMSVSLRRRGYTIRKILFKDQELFDKYTCLVCQFLLRDAVQSASCGHWFCEGCISGLLKTISPICPSCEESLKGEDEEEDSELYYPDKFVRRDIDALELVCLYKSSGCDWEGTFGKLSVHLETCEYSICRHCNGRLSLDPTEHVCKNSTTSQPPFTCPLSSMGCGGQGTYGSEALLQEHLRTEHLNNASLIHRIVSLESTVESLKSVSIAPTRKALQRVEPDGHPSMALDSGFGSGPFSGMPAERDHVGRGIIAKSATGVLAGDNMLLEGGQSVTKLRHDVMALQRELREKNEEIVSLRAMVNKLEKVQRSKTADFEDRDFRLSLIENSNHDGTMVWKIPQFSQRMDDAKSGKYTSIFSLPFYTGRYGYKMCLRLYILGDGIGKGSYMSLFFVLMKGEFDNILQWPFTHKVTFKLLNQSNGRDIVDTFQPDPMSSSFRKPKSDMNIASGCPRFISHADLKNGFTIDDTVFIKCIVDTSTIKHP